MLPPQAWLKLGLGIETQVLYLWLPGPSHAPESFYNVEG